MIKIIEGFYEWEFVLGKNPKGLKGLSKKEAAKFRIVVTGTKQRKFNKKEHDYHRSFATKEIAERRQKKAKKDSLISAYVTEGKNKNIGKKVFRLWIR